MPTGADVARAVDVWGLARRVRNSDLIILAYSDPENKTCRQTQAGSDMVDSLFVICWREQTNMQDLT